MSRFLVFDQATANAVQSRTGVPAAFDPAAADPASILAGALGSEAAIAVVPAGKPGKALLLRLSRPPMPPKPEPKPASSLAPAGFLGLTDAIDMDGEPEQPRKWWRKILG
jgi:hypothetical protein